MAEDGSAIGQVCIDVLSPPVPGAAGQSGLPGMVCQGLVLLLEQTLWVEFRCIIREAQNSTG